MITQRRPTVLTSLSVMTLLMASPAGAEIVFDPSVFARQFEQLTELKKQVDTLTSQLKVAQDQLNQAKQLYDSFNKRTNANDIGALLNTPQFRKVLPQQFSDIEKSGRGAGQRQFCEFDQPVSQSKSRLCRQQRQFVLPERARSDRAADRRQALHGPGGVRYRLAARRCP